ncbi:MAG TPA: hypothetical protein VJG65_01935 [Patescibacteria group bacterium]|nr:hypothetical protein [Patescibacteria group bacterium]
MPLNWKRILLLIGFIASVFAIGYLLYFVFLRPALPPTEPIVNGNVNLEPGVLPSAGTNVNIPTAGNVNGALPGGVSGNVNLAPPELPSGSEAPQAIAAGGLTQISSLTKNRVSQPILASDGIDSYYYDKTSGLFYRLTADGRATPLTNQTFFEVQGITWSPNKQMAVLEYPDGANIVYNFSTNKQITLPQHWQDFSFAPTGEKLVFKSLGSSAENRWLAIANLDGSNAKKIEALGDKDATVYPLWSPNNQIVAMFTDDAGFDRQNLYFLGANGENFKSTLIEGRGFQGQWSTKGDRLLYSVYSSDSGYRPALWIVDATGDQIGENRRNLKIETWADKCSFAENDTIYCAVPQNLEEGAGIFANDLDNSPTNIYKIDLKTGFRSLIARPEGNPNIDQLYTSQDGRYLYFTAKTDGRLYKINLK